VSTIVASTRRLLALEARNIGLGTDNARLKAENRQLRADLARAEAESRRLGREVDSLKRRITELLGSVETLRRASKRQSAPFSDGSHAKHPKRSGRKAGPGYGAKAHRGVPDHVDQTVEVACPARCPCGGAVVVDGVRDQYVEELPPVRSFVTRFRVHHGHCADCGAKVHGRHPDQTSDATGAAGSQIGPHASALAADLRKEMGISERKICRIFSHLGLSITPGGVAQVVARMARAATPTYRGLVAAARKAAVVAADESGWRVHGYSAWAWGFVGQATLPDGTMVRFVVYLIAKGRGFPEAAAVLGKDFDGVLERDGWAPYAKFVKASHQSCLQHLVRRAAGMIEDATGAQAGVPTELKAILADSLALRAARDAEEVPAAALPERIASLDQRVGALIDAGDAHPPNARLLKHLAKQRPHLFTFLARDDVQACNWKAEQAVRPLVVNRKAWGGNFSWNGAETQEVLSSVIATSRMQGKDPVSVLVPLLKSPTPRLAELVLPGVGEAEWTAIPLPAKLLPAPRPP
jgi:transposase